MDDAIVDSVKYRRSKDRSRTHFIPRGDVETFLMELADRSTLKPELTVFHVVEEVQFGGGPRIGETCAITWQDISDWNTGAVSISKSVQWSRKKGRATQISPLTKTGESRVIFLTSRALNALRKWKVICGRSKGLIFSFDGLNPIPYRSVQHHYDAAFKRVGLNWRSTHILRHSYATDFLEKTGDKVALQGQLGHKTSKQTDHYAKVTATAQHAGVRAYDESLKGLVGKQNVVDLFGKSSSEKSEALGEGLGGNAL